MTIKESQEKHEQLVRFVKGIIGRDDLEVQKDLVSTTEIPDKFDINKINSIAITVSKLMNLYGASVNDINLYELLQLYFLDIEKRKEINEIIGNGWRNKH